MDALLPPVVREDGDAGYRWLAFLRSCKGAALSRATDCNPTWEREEADVREREIERVKRQTKRLYLVRLGGRYTTSFRLLNQKRTFEMHLPVNKFHSFWWQLRNQQEWGYYRLMFRGFWFYLCILDSPSLKKLKQELVICYSVFLNSASREVTCYADVVYLNLILQVVKPTPLSLPVIKIRFLFSSLAKIQKQRAVIK